MPESTLAPSQGLRIRAPTSSLEEGGVRQLRCTVHEVQAYHALPQKLLSHAHVVKD
jgi:hypothetical protein